MCSKFKKMMFLGFIVLVISCNSNVADNSSTKAGNMGRNPQSVPNGEKACEGQMSAEACPSHGNALQYQCRLPQGIKPTECETVLTLANSSSSVYDYLNHVNEAYKNEYYAANIDIIAIAESILKSQSPEEICRLSIQSLKALDSVRTNFRDPYGYLEDVYGRFLRASQATKAESCLGGK